MQYLLRLLVESWIENNDFYQIKSPSGEGLSKLKLKTTIVIFNESITEVSGDLDLVHSGSFKCRIFSTRLEITQTTFSIGNCNYEELFGLLPNPHLKIKV